MMKDITVHVIINAHAVMNRHPLFSTDLQKCLAELREVLPPNISY